MPKLHLYFHTPTPVFKARVNMVSTTYPVSAITFDNVTLGSYTDISFDMTILLGTTEGADDLGRHRVQKPATADTIYVARSSRGIEDGQLDVEDNAYITVLEDYRVWARLPYFNLTSGIDYKDGDVPVGDFNTDLPPIANCGSPFADYIDPDTNVITVELPNEGINLSRAMADGATIDTYAWDVGDGTITVGTASDDVITATFPAGFRYVSLTVTDSNGVPHTSRTPVLAIDPADDPTIRSFTLSQRLEWSGQTLDVNIHEEMERTDYPDGTLVLFWWDAPASPGDRSHMKFVGWVDNESYNVGRDKRGVVKRTTLRCVDVCGRLATLPGFPQALSRIEDESPWSYMPSLDMNKSLWYLGFWHSTALNLADFILPEDGDDYDAMRLDSGAASLYEQMSQQAQKMVPDHYLVCNAKGQMIFQLDWRLEDVGDRPTSAPIITEDYWNDIQIEYSRHPKVHVLRSGAILSSTELDEDELIPVVFSIAPSDAEAFGQGVQEHVENEGLALSQEALNKSEGHRYAMLNSRYGDFTLRDPSGSAFWDYEPAAFNRVQLNIPANLAAQRGLDFTQASGLVKSISVQYQTDKRGTVVKPSVVWAKETSGYPALTHIPEEVDDIGYVPPVTVPPDFGLTPSQESVAAIDEDGTLYRTTDFQTDSGSGGPTWTQHDLGITDSKVYSFVVDPFSPGYINGSGTINGWVVTESDIYRVTDMFGTPSATSVHTFATAISPADIRQSRTIQASFGAYFAAGVNPWLLVISHYADAAGHTGTWALRSLDGGSTWLGETVVTSHYDSAQPSLEPATEIAVHASPKVPGLAYTSAYTETADLAATSGYKSTDWGETWLAIVSEFEDIPEPFLPHWGHLVNGSFEDLQSHAVSWGTGAVSDDAGIVESPEHYFLLIPPADARRVLVAGNFIETQKCENGTVFGVAYDGNFGSDQPMGFGTERTGLPKAGGGEVNGASYRINFTIEWTRSGPSTEWMGNRDDLLTTTPSDTTGHCHLFLNALVNAGLGRLAIIRVFFDAWVEEIEMEDGTIYRSTPAIMQSGNRPSASLHAPWVSNPSDLDLFATRTQDIEGWQHATMKTTNSVPKDVSPITYGPRRSGFGIRAYDSDRNYMVMGAANRSGDPTSNLSDHAVFTSVDGGETWTMVLGPTASTLFTGKPGYSAAFSGNDPNVLYIWGAPDGVDGCIAYSDDFGVTVDSREGNLGSFGISSFLGIAGGPTGG